MDAFQFLQQISAQASADNPVPKTRLGFIDYDFNPKTYPQVLPKVNIDGEGLSPYGYVCLSSYTPVPGDRVVLLPHSTSYVILGAIGRTDRTDIQPGGLALALNNHSVVGTQTMYVNASNPSSPMIWGDSVMYDPMGFWDPDTPTDINLRPGRYLLSGRVCFPTTGSTVFRHAEYRVNGNVSRAGRARTQVAVSNQLINLDLPTIQVNINTPSTLTVEVYATTTSSGSATTHGALGAWGNASDSSNINVIYVGPPSGGMSDVWFSDV